MWFFKLTLPYVDMSNEICKWIMEIKEGPFKRTVSTVVHDKQWVIIESDEIRFEELRHFYQLSPPHIKDLMKYTYERGHIYLDAVYSLNPSDVYESVTKLQCNKSFIVTDNWDPLHRKPFESDVEYHKRLNILIPIQMVLTIMVKTAEQQELDWDKGFKLNYKNIMLHVPSYIETLKHRERRKFIPLIKRLLDNCKKIRDLRKTNLDTIINTNLQDCK